MKLNIVIHTTALDASCRLPDKQFYTPTVRCSVSIPRGMVSFQKSTVTMLELYFQILAFPLFSNQLIIVNCETKKKSHTLIVLLSATFTLEKLLSLVILCFIMQLLNRRTLFSHRAQIRHFVRRNFYIYRLSSRTCNCPVASLIIDSTLIASLVHLDRLISPS